MQAEANEIVVMGIGNLLCSDDGVGVHAARTLSEVPLPALTVDIGTAILHALPFLEYASHLLVLDAVRGPGEPGDIYAFDGFDTAGRQVFDSLHSMGLAEAMRHLGQGVLPRVFRVLGVEPASVAYGTSLSAPVTAALPRLVDEASQIVHRWHATDARRHEQLRVRTSL